MACLVTVGRKVLHELYSEIGHKIAPVKQRQEWTLAAFITYKDA